MWSCKITWQTEIITYSITMSMAINFGGVGIYNEEFPSIKSPDPLIVWSYKVMETILATVSLLPQGLWPQNVAKW